VITVTRQDRSIALAPGSRLTLWIVVGLIVLALLAYRVVQIHRLAAATLQWQAKTAAADAASKAIEAQILALFHQHAGKWRQEDLEFAINQHRPFVLTTTNNPGEMEAQWKDPVSGRPFHFSFYNGRWLGMGSNWGTKYLPRQPGMTPIEEDLERCRRAFAGFNSGIGPAIWIVLVFAFLLLRRWRPILAEALLALALLCGAAWLIHPGYPLTLWGIMRNDMLFWAALMLISSSVLYARVLKVRTRERGLVCPSCGYSLVGNVSGTCPECGAAVPAEMRTQLSSVAQTSA
jgi:hypothetical protein